MTEWRDVLAAEVTERNAYTIVLTSQEGAGAGPDEAPMNGGGLIAYSWKDGSTIAVEAGIDSLGAVFALIRPFGGDGESVDATVMSGPDGSIYISVPIETDDRKE